jgi:type I restriction enzyme S subunit
MKENTLPDGWEVKKLKEVIVKTKNVNPKTSSFDEFTYIDISAVDKSLQEIVSPKTVQSLEAPSRAKKSIEINDILFATTRPNLKNIAIVSISYDFPIASTGFCVIRTNNETDNRYVFYYLTSDFLQEQIEPKIRGAQYPAISDKDLKGIFIPIPSLEEQKRIVAKIDTLFAKIDKAISLTEESLVQAKNLLPSVLKELFEKGKADGWEEKKLGEVIEKTKNVNPKTSSFDEFTYIDISAVDKSLQEIVLPKTVKSIGAPSRAKKSIELDDILFATTRPNLKNIAIVSVLYEFPIASTGFCVVRSNSETHNRYLFYYLISDLLQEQIEPYIRGAQYPAISDKDLKSVLIPVPNLKEQIQLSELFDKISEESKKTQSKLEEQLAYLKQLKSSILTKAFKGEL